MLVICIKMVPYIITVFVVRLKAYEISYFLLSTSIPSPPSRNIKKLPAFFTSFNSFLANS